MKAANQAFLAQETPSTLTRSNVKSLADSAITVKFFQCAADVVQVGIGTWLAVSGDAVGGVAMERDLARLANIYIAGKGVVDFVDHAGDIKDLSALRKAQGA